MLLQRALHSSYIIAVAAVVVALLIRLLLEPLLGGQMPFYVFYFAVIVASIRGGIGPGLAALAIAYVVAAYFFAFPRFSFDIGDKDVDAFRFLTLGLAMVLAGGWVSAQRSDQQYRMEEKQQRILSEKQAMHNTLTSIGDGLITTDAHGRISFMNEVAERLCGWTTKEAEGRYAREIFCLVQGPRQETIVDPLWLCLRERRLVTVPDGAILRSRNGVEHAIGDTASPIRDRDGAVIGAVLVFHEVVRPIVAQEPMTGRLHVGSIEFNTGDHVQPQLPAQELQRLDLICRDWLEKEWQPAEKAVRLIHLNGLDLVIKQRFAESLADGTEVLHFQVTYDQPGPVSI
jgi:PAS domain S-box-containing protein